MYLLSVTPCKGKGIMANITIIEKPDWITFDDIHNLLYSAHEINREKGFVVKTALMSGEELKEHIGDRGKCFVALDGDKLVGTTSYRVLDRNYWCAKGEVLDRVLAGVSPEYKGMHISTMLFSKIVEEAKKNGFKYIESKTAEDNEIVQIINLKDGYRYIDFKSTTADHYTVVMLQWLDGCPYTQKQTDRYFKLKRFLVKLRFKPGRIKRFGI